MVFEIVTPLKLPQLKAKKSARSLFNEQYDSAQPIQAKIFGGSLIGSSFTTSPALLQANRPILREGVLLSLHQEDRSRPEVTATIDPNYSNPFQHRTFLLDFKLPEGISAPDLEEFVHPDLLKFLIDSLINPVQRFLQN